MAAGSKKPSKRHGAATTGRRFAGGKPVSASKDASPARGRKMQARSGGTGKGTIGKPARGRAQTRRKTTSIRAAGQMDAVLAAQLEAIANGLEQIPDIRAELQELRTIVEELVQTVAALVANSAVSGSDLEQSAPTPTDEVLIVETYDIPADGDEALEPSRATPD
jgi:hypothetical protein